jgi:hypothetical protein
VRRTEGSLLTLHDFYAGLARLLRRLITAEGYRYTGVFDVGRAGFSAVRNLPRTGPGLSGWYGRALMGDALMSVPAVALTRPGHVLGFIGDGAAALVPDIVPSLVQQMWSEGRRMHGNTSLFFLANGGHSIIRSYRETRRGAGSDDQMKVLNPLPADEVRTYGPVTVRRRRLTGVPDDLGRELVESETLNLYWVVVAHDSNGDGLSLQAAADWRHRPYGPVSR